MGTFFNNGQTRNELIAELVRREENSERTLETVKHCLRGNCLWRQARVTFKDGRPPMFYIAVDLLTKSGKEWGYKPMDVTVHPYYYTCPYNWLAEVPCSDSKHEKEWRAVMKTKHEMKKRALAVGQRYTLPDRKPNEIRITNLKPLLGQSAEGMVYSLKRSFLGELIQD